MAFKATHHRRHPQLNDHYARADSLLIGPGGEIVAAYGAGNRIPAIPEPITGRLVQNTQAPDAQTQTISVVEASATLMASDTNKLSGITSATAAVSSAEASSPLATTTASMSESVSSTLNTDSLTASPSGSSATTSPLALITSIPSSSNSDSTSAATSTSAVTSTPSSATPTSTSRPTSSLTQHRNVYFGIALAAIAAVGIVVVLIVWSYRTRSRTRRAVRRRRMLWPWHRGGGDTEDGLGATKEYPFGRFGSLNEKERVDGELSYPQYPAMTLGPDEMLRVPVHLPALSSPFRPVIPHLQSVPDLTPNLGFLQVANYMPGDASSEEGSRANSRQGTDPSVADARSPAAPWATYGPEDGFQNPWPPLKPRRGLGIRTTSGESRPTIAEEHKAPDPAAAQQIQEGWAASIRSSINSALSSMVGQLDPPAEDTLIRLSEQRATAHEFEETSHETGVHSSNTSVLSNPFGDPSVDLDVTSPCNRSEDDAHHDPNCLCEWLKQKQGPAVHLSTLRAPSPDVTHDCPSPRSTYGASPGKAASTPLLTLPAIPVSRAASISSLHQAIKRKHPQRGRSKKFASRAMTALDRMHSASGSSASFPMSRESSTASTTSGPLSDQEQFASTALRERRKRVMDAQRLAARQSLKRPSVRLGSRRQNNGSRALGVASALRGRMSS